MFFEQAFDGRKKWWKYLIGIAVIAFGWQFIGAIPLVVVLIREASLSQLQELNDPTAISDFLGSTRFMVLALVMFLGGMMAIWIWIRAAHKRTFSSLISAGKTNYKKIFTSFGLTFLYYGVLWTINYFLNPEDFVWNFQPEQFFILVALSIFLLPFQTSFEEIYFRGYLMQWFGVLMKSKFWPLLITSAAFGLLHAFNPEVSVLGWSTMIYYVGFGLFMGIITIMDDGLELAIGFHWATNFFGFSIISNHWGTAQTETLVKDVAEPSLTWEMLIPTLCLPLFYVLFARMYKWGSLKQLMGRVELPQEPELIIEDQDEGLEITS